VGAEENLGTRFRLFPQAPFLAPDREPVQVIVNSRPGTIGPGPSDDRLYVIKPIGKQHPYGVLIGPYGTPYLSLPPWRGPIETPAMPDPCGHFDYIPVGTVQFAQAHVFGVVRFVLNVWETYFGRRIGWHFASDLRRLEVVILPTLENARMGYGYLEVGSVRNENGFIADFSLNFDVIAHEVGHLLLYRILGLPVSQITQKEYFGFQESAADTIGLISALHFDTMIKDLLTETRGNLYTFNELNRFAELSQNEQIRLASNDVKLSRFEYGWVDEHDLSEPLTGAIFDILVDIFQETLVDRGLISRKTARLSNMVRSNPDYEPIIQAAFDATYPLAPDAFRLALTEARDTTGQLLAETWKRLGPDFLSFEDVGNNMLAMDQLLTAGRYNRPIAESFAWREIGKVKVGPHLAPSDASHALSSRTIVPGITRLIPKMSLRERFVLARQS
jgi:hypothetical protein